MQKIWNFFFNSKVLWVCLIFSQSLAGAAENKTLVYGIPEDVVTLNPFTTSGASAWMVQSLVFDFFAKEAPDSADVFVPSVAESWSLSQDFLTYTFKIRSSLVWSDGQPVTMDDVVFSVRHLFSDKYKSIWRGMFLGFKNLRVVDTQTLEIQVDRADYDLWRNFMLMLRILPKHIYEQPNSKKEKAKALVGSGPYKVQSFAPGEKIVLEKNPSYWGYNNEAFKDWYKFDKLVFKSVHDTLSLESYISQGVIDLFRVTDNKLSQSLAEGGKKDLILFKDPNREQARVDMLFFNLSDPLFKDAEFRKILRQLPVRADICRKLYGEDVRPIFSMWGDVSPVLSVPELDMKAKLQLLAEAGWKDQDKDGVLEKTIGSRRVKARFEVTYSQRESEGILTMLKEQFKQYGVDLQLRRIDEQLAWKTLRGGKFQAVLYSLPHDRKIGRVTWHSKGDYNNTKIAVPELDKLLDVYVKEFNLDKRRPIEKELRQIIEAEDVAVPLCLQPAEIYAVSKRFQPVRSHKGLPIWSWLSGL